jgi:signal transduction histidine kinase/CheY-like chemotaxis protein
MATILVVDDEPANRELLVTLLGYANHRVLEAPDGAAALAQVQAERPDLVIADVLMPAMDGYELVHRLRAQPDVAATTVVFYTAHYLEREARALAEKCGVRFFITKPSDPEVILRTVDAALGLEGSASSPPEQFAQEHLKLVSHKLLQKVDELQAVNHRLGALLEVSQQLASERNPQVLLDAVCRSGRELIGAAQALIAIWDNGRSEWRHFLSNGLAPEASRHLVPAPPGSGTLAALLNERTSLRLAAVDALQNTGLPDRYPTATSLLGVRIASPTRMYGWLCLTNKFGAAEFSEDDEQRAVTLASLAGRIYENGSLYGEVHRRAQELEREVEERRRAEAALEDRTKVALLGSDIGAVLTREDTLREALQRCAEALVQHLDAAFARIWTLGRDRNVLELLASAGMYTHIDGAHSRIKVGEKKIGKIAADGEAVMTDAVIGDPRVSEQDWAKREGMVAFAGFPLVVANQVVGVMAMFARQPFPRFTLRALAAAADEIALGIHRMQAVEELRTLNAELERRVGERTAQLDAANHELEAFSYSVSQDLTAPLRHVDGFNRLLREEVGDQLNPTARQYLERIEAGTQHMAQLIQDLLSLSRVMRHELSLGIVDLSKLATIVAVNLQKSTPDRQVEFTITPGLVANGDAGLLRIVLDNLLGNAWKYTSKRGRARIELGITERDGQAVYFVRDDGAGFDMAYAEKLFVAFQRLHSESEFEGTGIGLATVQRIIQRHGGRVWGEATPEQGATFFFTLPPAEAVTERSDGEGGPQR